MKNIISKYFTFTRPQKNKEVTLKEFKKILQDTDRQIGRALTKLAER